MKVQRPITLTLALALVALGAVACGGGNSTPTKAFQTFYSALKNKDAKAMKSVMSKDMLDEGEKVAKEKNKTIDDLIKEAFFDRMTDEVRSKLPDKIETRNETIASDGKTATLEAKDP